MKAALYIRTSTDKQEGGAETQRQNLEDFARRREFEVVKVYEDIGESGTSEKRHALDKLMEDARNKHIDVVLVQRLDRLGRSVRHLLHVLDELQSLGVAFISMTQGVDTSTPAGRMILVFLGAVAEFEKELIRERVKAGIARARRQGKRLGRPRAKLNTDEVMALRAEGKSIRQIASLLNCSKSVVGNMIRCASEGVLDMSLKSDGGSGNGLGHASGNGGQN